MNGTTSKCISRSWFQICFIFIPTWGRFPFWPIFFQGVETTNQIYLLSFSVQILQLPASPFVWFPVFLTHGFTPSWMLGDIDPKPSKTNMVCPHKSQQKWSKKHPELLWSLDPQKHNGLEKDFPFSTIGICLVSSWFSREYVFVCDICGTFLNNIHRYDFGQKVRSSTSITSSTTSLTSFLGTANQNDVVGGLVWCRSKTCLSAFILSV